MGKTRKLHKAVRSGNLEEVTKVITQDITKKKKYTIDEEDKDGETALTIACSMDSNLGIIQLLVAHGANINHKNKSRVSMERRAITPFGFLCCRCDIIGLKYFIEDPSYTGPRPDVGDATYLSTPLIDLFSDKPSPTKCVEAIRLIVKAGCDVNKVSDFGNTALHKAASCGHIEPVLELIRQGADANILNKAGRTPFVAACASSQYVTASELYRYTKDIDIVDKYGNTPLHLACVDGNGLLIDFLLECGADPNIEDSNKDLPLNIIVSKKNIRDACIERLVSATNDLSHVSKDGVPMLYFAAYSNNQETVKLLLKYGADPNQISTTGYRGTVLTGVCAKNGPRNPDIVRMLLEAGANPNQPDKDGYTPLHYCCDAGDLPGKPGTIALGCLRVLVEYGGDIHRRCNNGGTPVSMAKNWNVPGCIQYFNTNPQPNPHRVTGFERYTPTSVDLLKRKAIPVVRQIMRIVKASLVESKNFLMTRSNYRDTFECIIDALVKNSTSLPDIFVNNNTRYLCSLISDELTQYFKNMTQKDDMSKYNPTIPVTNSILMYIVAKTTSSGSIAAVDMLHATIKAIFDQTIPLSEGCELVTLLVRRKADLNCIGYNNLTPLAYACSFKGCHPYLARVLSDGVDNIDYTASYGQTALSCACINENFDVIKLLLSRWANPNIIPQEIRDKFTVQVRDFVSDNMVVDGKLIKDTAEKLAKSMLRQSTASKYLSAEQIKELQGMLSLILYKSTFIKRLYNDNDTSVILLRNDICEVVGKKITSFIANTHLFNADTGKFTAEMKPALEEAILAAYMREKIATSEEKIIADNGIKSSRSKDKHHRKSMAVSSPSRDEEKIPYEKQKELSAKQKERDFKHKLTKLKEEVLKCRTENAEELRNLDKKFQDLEAQANTMKNSEFYMIRASFYEKAAEKDTADIRKQALYKKALQDYNRVLDIDTFATGIVEKIEYIKEKLKPNTVVSVSTGIPPAYAPSVIQTSSNTNIPHYPASSTAAAAAAGTAYVLPHKHTETHTSSLISSSLSNQSTNVGNAGNTSIPTIAIHPIDRKNITDYDREEIERIKQRLRADRTNATQ